MRALHCIRTLARALRPESSVCMDRLHYSGYDLQPLLSPSNEVSETIVLYFSSFFFSRVKLKRMPDLCLVYDFRVIHMHIF